MQRFWNKVNKDGPNGCWEWTAAVCRRGYGRFRLDGKLRQAHCVSWMLKHGPIPAGEGYHGTCVLHRCDNRRCVNPAHLFLGTHADNMRDMTEKSRTADRAGESNGNAKLTEADIPTIRADKRIQRVIAAEYGVSPQHIERIKNRKTWKHI